MNNCIYIYKTILVVLVLLVSGIQGITMSKDDVINFKVVDYNYNKAECPKYSYDAFNGIACSFRFICLEDDCQSVTKDTNYLKFSNTTQSKEYIVKYCTIPDYRYNGCATPKCSTDSDCISNRCEDGVCLEGDQSPFTECRDTYQKEDHKDPAYMVCGRLEGERCSEDRECAGVCVAADSRYHTSFFKKSKEVEGQDVKRCQAYGVNEDGFNFMVGYHLIAIIVVLLFLILMCCCLCSYCC